MRDQKRKTMRSKARAYRLGESRKRVKLFNGIMRTGHGNPAREDSVAEKLAVHGFEIRVNRPSLMGSREERKAANITRRAKSVNKGGIKMATKTRHCRFGICEATGSPRYGKKICCSSCEFDTICDDLCADEDDYCKNERRGWRNVFIGIAVAAVLIFGYFAWFTVHEWNYLTAGVAEIRQTTTAAEPIEPVAAPEESTEVAQ